MKRRELFGTEERKRTRLACPIRAWPLVGRARRAASVNRHQEEIMCTLPWICAERVSLAGARVGEKRRPRRASQPASCPGERAFIRHGATTCCMRAQAGATGCSALGRFMEAEGGGQAGTEPRRGGALRSCLRYRVDKRRVAAQPPMGMNHRWLVSRT